MCKGLPHQIRISARCGDPLWKRKELKVAFLQHDYISINSDLLWHQKPKKTSFSKNEKHFPDIIHTPQQWCMLHSQRATKLHKVYLIYRQLQHKWKIISHSFIISSNWGSADHFMKQAVKPAGLHEALHIKSVLHCMPPPSSSIHTALCL